MLAYQFRYSIHLDLDSTHKLQHILVQDQAVLDCRRCNNGQRKLSVPALSFCVLTSTIWLCNWWIDSLHIRRGFWLFHVGMLRNKLLNCYQDLGPTSHTQTEAFILLKEAQTWVTHTKWVSKKRRLSDWMPWELAAGTLTELHPGLVSTESAHPTWSQ